MKTSTSEGKHGIKWTAWNQLNHLEFTDDLALISHTRQQIQMKVTRVATNTNLMGVNIHKLKARSSNTTQRTPTQSLSMEKLWEMSKLHISACTPSSMNNEDPV
ncbi:unnamed protein product [Schistosoma margrebowiei]|uniref:Uncharacterized protein n=1 Tax=Schistosoma margrebowiei TaxID=48269 RepID=A0A183MZC1_9TREM|nr:unnamed protein product [Schistosoma margrebowiei]